MIYKVIAVRSPFAKVATLEELRKVKFCLREIFSSNCFLLCFYYYIKSAHGLVLCLFIQVPLETCRTLFLCSVFWHFSTLQWVFCLLLRASGISVQLVFSLGIFYDNSLGYSFFSSFPFWPSSVSWILQFLCGSSHFLTFLSTKLWHLTLILCCQAVAS